MSEAGNIFSRSLMATVALLVAAGLMGAATVMSGWTFLAINSFVVVAALLFAGIALAVPPQHPQARVLLWDLAGVLAFVGCAALAIYEWDHLFLK